MESLGRVRGEGYRHPFHFLKSKSERSVPIFKAPKKVPHFLEGKKT